MRKLKTALAVLLVLCALAAAACLPWAVTRIMDLSQKGRVGLADISPVKLEFSPREADLGPEYMLGRLKLEASMSTVPVDEKDAAMTKAEVVDAVEEGMGRYEAAGIFEWFDYSEAYATPYLGIDPNEPDNFSIFWTVSMVQEEDPYRSLFLHVDDATGAIISIRYECYGEYDENAAVKQSPYTMGLLVDIFFGQLGLNASVIANESGGELDGGVLFARYNIPSETMENVYVDFYVTGPGGFSTYFPTEDTVKSEAW